VLHNTRINVCGSEWSTHEQLYLCATKLLVLCVRIKHIHSNSDEIENSTKSFLNTLTVEYPVPNYIHLCGCGYVCGVGLRVCA
jgi:hypothetical protein